jgi:hypothetical protein
MVSVIALLCAATIARSGCKRANAIDVVKLADVADQLSCMRESMPVLAGLAIRLDLTSWKVVCE